MFASLLFGLAACLVFTERCLAVTSGHIGHWSMPVTIVACLTLAAGLGFAVRGIRARGDLASYASILMLGLTWSGILVLVVKLLGK